MATFTLHAEINAPVETVFDVLSDHAGYQKITPLRSSTLEREGSPDRNGVGAVRRLALVGPPIREEITEYERPRLLSYKALSGVPAKTHTGMVRLSERGDGTILTWHVDSTPKLPSPDAVYVAAMKQAISPLMRGVAKESEQRARAGS